MHHPFSPIVSHLHLGADVGLRDGMVTAQAYSDDARAEYDSVRQASLTLFRSFTPAQLDRAGTASNNPLTVRALLFVLPGHEAHHLSILRERYLPLLGSVSSHNTL